MNFNMKLAGINISVTGKYDYLKKFCRDYLTDETDAAINATCTESEIENERAQIPGAHSEVAETICIYRSIAERLPDFSRFVFHGAVITCDDDAYMFTAPSGTGKTTHIRLWKKYMTNSVDIVNGDKPIIEIGDSVTAYGTPWSGKEGYQKNRNAVLKGICIITRGTENTVRRLTGKECVDYLMRQVYLPKTGESLVKTLSLLNALIEKIPCFIASVDMSENAVKATYEALTNKKYGK